MCHPPVLDKGRMDEMYLGIDIGGTDVKLGILNRCGNFRHVIARPVNFDAYETPILQTVKTETVRYLQEYAEECGTLEGIGVSATGGIDMRTGTVISSAGHIKNWEGSRIKEELEEQFSVPVTVINDANAAVLGETWLGSARGKRNVVMLTIGTGVGGGILTDAGILAGAAGLAGEVGHMIIRSGQERCSCGNEGCLERYGSMTALIRRIEHAIAEGTLKGDWTERVNGKSIFAQIAAGNAGVERITDEWIEDIAAGIISLVHIFNPETVVLGGGVSAQEELFVDSVRRKVKKGVMPAFSDGLEIRAAQLGNRAGMAGAVYYWIQQEK